MTQTLRFRKKQKKKSGKIAPVAISINWWIDVDYGVAVPSPSIFFATFPHSAFDFSYFFKISHQFDIFVFYRERQK